MGNILDQIIGDKRAEVDRAKRERPLSQVKRRAKTADPPRDFWAAAARQNPHGVNLIGEIKRRSPSAGLIRKDFDPAGIARTYWQAGASAISVLTDERYFDGRLDHIHQARMATPLPVLRKDFVVDAYQVWEARAETADAVLLIAETLGASALVELTGLAGELGMSVLVEAHRPDCLRSALAVLGSPLPPKVLIGVNNRDLAAQRTDLATTERLAAMLPGHCVLVSESGIRTREDVLFVTRAGAHAILVGEAIMAASDMSAKINELLGTAQ